MKTNYRKIGSVLTAGTAALAICLLYACGSGEKASAAAPSMTENTGAAAENRTGQNTGERAEAAASG